MNATRMACLILSVGVLVAAAGPSRSDDPPVAPAPRVKRLTDAEVGALIARVGSPAFAEREAATAELGRRPEALAAAARALAAANNPEVARRLGGVVRTLQADWANRRLAKLPEYVKRRQFDRLVETMVACREHLTSEHDVHVRAFIKDVCEATLPDAGGRWNGWRWWNVFESFAWSQRLGHQGLIRSPNIVAREAVPLGGREGMAVAASDRIAPGSIDGMRLSQFIGCVALCNGEVETDGMVGGFLLATGPVRVRGNLGGAVVVSLADVEVWSADTCVIVSQGRAPTVKDQNSVVRPNANEFFRDWEMFSARDCAHLRSVFGTVWADPMPPGCPFDRAGVRSGERIERIDGTPVRTARDAYRLLCRAAVTTGDATVVTVGADRRRELVVHLQSW